MQINARAGSSLLTLTQTVHCGRRSPGAPKPGLINKPASGEPKPRGHAHILCSKQFVRVPPSSGKALPWLIGRRGDGGLLGCRNKREMRAAGRRAGWGGGHNVITAQLCSSISHLNEYCQEGWNSRPPSAPAPRPALNRIHSHYIKPALFYPASI